MAQAREVFLQDAVARGPGHEVQISIRDFIGKWGAQRRGYWYVQAIRDDLNKHQLRTDPSFEDGWIDSQIRLIPTSKSVATEASVNSAATGTDSPQISDDQVASQISPQGGLKVSRLSSANVAVLAISPTDSLAKAQSLMLRFDYSQLPVLNSPRDVRGSVSWESIAQRLLHDKNCSLKDCIVPVDVVGLDDDLLPHVPRIIQGGYVLVRARDKTISGLVTTSDLSGQFLGLAEPFLLVGEAERRLRSITAAQFSLEEIMVARDPRDAERTVSSVENLSLGELTRMFQSTERWDKLAWQADRKVFNAALEHLAEFRNEVMHFSSDEIESTRLAQVRHLIKWLGFLDS